MAAYPVPSSDDEEWSPFVQPFGEQVDARSAALDANELAFFAAQVDNNYGDDGMDSAEVSRLYSAAAASRPPVASCAGNCPSSHCGFAPQSSSTSHGRSSWAQVVEAAHTFDQTVQYEDMRGKYDRSNAQKRSKWNATASNHWYKVQHPLLLGAERCSAACPMQGQYMAAAFTVSTLRKCSSRLW
eukprot:1925854-Pleurochrysis_carterae.AAC.3